MFQHIWCGKTVKANNHIQFYIKSNSESFSICYIVPLTSICGCLQVDISYNFLHFCVLSLILLRKNDQIMFSIKFLLESLKINYIDILYHTHQYVLDYKSIY